jgi:hypothetical protein
MTMKDELHREEKIPCTALTATPSDSTDSRPKQQLLPKRPPAPNTGGGLQKSRKHRAPEERAHSSYPKTIPGLTDLLATCTDEQYIQIIHQLPEGWSATNERGTRVTKRQSEIGHWGAYKDDHSVLTFQQTILHTRQYSNTTTQFDTLLAQSIVEQNDV